MNDQRRKPDWQLVKDFTDEDSGLTVRLTRDMNNRFPRFSIEIGRQGRDDGGLFRNMAVMLDRDSGSVFLRHNLEKILARLIADAQELVLETAQREEEDFRRQREARFDGGGDQRGPMRKGKTDRDRRRRGGRRDYGEDYG